MTAVLQTLHDVIAGSVASLADIENVSDAELTAVAAGSTFVLSSAAVALVLDAYGAGALAQKDVQRWASFVRHGYLPGRQGPIRPLDIEYEPEHEDAIVETLARLDELGDAIDGDLREGEAAELREALAGTPTSRP